MPFRSLFVVSRSYLKPIGPTLFALSLLSSGVYGCGLETENATGQDPQAQASLAPAVYVAAEVGLAFLAAGAVLARTTGADISAIYVASQSSSAAHQAASAVLNAAETTAAAISLAQTAGHSLTDAEVTRFAATSAAYLPLVENVYLDRARYDVQLAESVAVKLLELQTAVTRAEAALAYMDAAAQGGWDAAGAEEAFRVHALQALAQADQLVQCPSCAAIGVLDAGDLDQLPILLAQLRGRALASPLADIRDRVQLMPTRLPSGGCTVEIVCRRGSPSGRRQTIHGSGTSYAAAVAAAKARCWDEGGYPGEVIHVMCD
jgi:hypothetical protein